MSATHRLALLGACALLQACGGSHAVPDPTNTGAPVGHEAQGKNGVSHIVIVVQENRSFDNLFHGFPGADSATEGLTHSGTSKQLAAIPLATSYDIAHGERNFLRAFDGGKNDGFDLEDPGKNPYAYVRASDVQPDWNLAQRYVVADRMFASQIDGSFTAHQYLIAAQAGAMVDYPTALPWGCDAPTGTIVPTLNEDRTEGPGVFPCLSYGTLAGTMDAANVSWRYYAPALTNDAGSRWSAFDVIPAVRHGPDWDANVISPETSFLSDVASGTLANVTWIVPDDANSDHSGTNSSSGPDWVASIANAVGNSEFWKTSVVLVVWDDWGGWYDHVPPKVVDAHGLGFRVPLIVVSPFAKAGYVSHVPYEFGSIVKFVESTFDLPPLAASDLRANSLDDCFQFGRPPRPYSAIRTKRSATTFMREIPSGTPPDTE